MASYRVEHAADVAAPASAAYRLIADYRNGHTRIIPPKYFSNLVVESGSGYGAGTGIAFDMTVLGQTQHMRAVVEEPQPGRVLVERDVAGAVVTTFEVVPTGDRSCRVRIATEMRRKPGVSGAIEKFLAMRLLPKIYRLEIAQLERVARE